MGRSGIGCSGLQCGWCGVARGGEPGFIIVFDVESRAERVVDRRVIAVEVTEIDCVHRSGGADAGRE